MPRQYTWTDERLAQAERLLEQLGSVDAAAGRMGTTPNSLKHAFRIHRDCTPGDIARRAASTIHESCEPVAKASASQRLAGPESPEPPPPPQGTVRRILVCPDVHAPYHDHAAWAVFMQVARELRPDILVVIGDFFDCYAVSQFVKDPERVRFLRDELEEGKRLIRELAELRVPRVVYCEGNHEFRIPRFLARHAPELHGFVHLPAELGLAALGWEWVPYREHITIGKMGYTHDLERHGVYAARWTLHDFGSNITFGHTHRGCIWYEGTLREGPRVCANVGWLGDVNQVDYRHQAKARRESQTGFGVEYQDQSGTTYSHFVPIIRGRCEVEGRLIAA